MNGSAIANLQTSLSVTHEKQSVSENRAVRLWEADDESRQKDRDILLGRTVSNLVYEQSRIHKWLKATSSLGVMQANFHTVNKSDDSLVSQETYDAPKFFAPPHQVLCLWHLCRWMSSKRIARVLLSLYNNSPFPSYLLPFKTKPQSPYLTPASFPCVFLLVVNLSAHSWAAISQGSGRKAFLLQWHACVRSLWVSVCESMKQTFTPLPLLHTLLCNAEITLCPPTLLLLLQVRWVFFSSMMFMAGQQPQLAALFACALLI